MTIGETLAQARRRAGLSVSQVSEQTRIRPLIIRGIEADEYAICGGDFYARGNIRDMAEVVGVDAEPLIEEYDRTHRAAGPVAATSLDELLDRSRPRPAHWHRRPAFMLVFGVVAVVIVLSFVGYRMMAPQRGPAGVSAAANTQATASQGGSGAAGRPDAARSARATAGSGPSASPPSQATAPTPSGTAASAPAGAPAPSATPAPTASPGLAQPQSMTPASAAAFGANGGLGRGDDPQDAHLAIDGLRGTAWHTDWYTTPRFGNLYSGTGLVVDMGRPVTVTAVRVTLGPAAGARFQIRVGDQPNLAAMAPVTGSAGPGGVIRMTLARPATGRYVMVWFTGLPPDPAGTYKAEIYGISVKGRP
ncbi:MAG TPA: helix-turn-helix domain-containing protein [Streptosporangiaceae bacterium]